MLKKWIGLLLAAALLAGGWSPAAGRFLPRPAGQEDRVVRVAYPVQAGLTDFDEFGNYSGYTYEYLEEIARIPAGTMSSCRCRARWTTACPP